MSRKPALLLRVTDIWSVTVSNDPAEGAILRFTMEGDPNDLDLQLPALAVVRLQTLLLEADIQQASLTVPQ
ncbi:hypothetical protein [Bosea sp. Root483D1]|uniref:hypothetical protein n=1 Tax=Bosea sp. Root483D1 TaxID=1736544 RepID=UPI000AAEAFA6|nr:hypothetical protein [Bosea sp. Root483D1]